MSFGSQRKLPATSAAACFSHLFPLQLMKANGLCTMFDQPVVSDQLKWEDWKQQFLFATLLYGGFENEEDVYQAFLDKELPEGKTSFHWDAKLPEGYCKVAYTIYEHYIDDPEYGPPIQKRTATLRVNFYESYELYEKFMEIMANQQT